MLRTRKNRAVPSATQTHQESNQNKPPEDLGAPDAPKSRGGYLDNIQQHMRRFVDAFAKAVELDNTDLMRDRVESLQKLTSPSQIRPLLKSLKAIFPDKSLPQYARDILRSKGLSEEEISSPSLSPAKKKRWLHTPEAKELTSIIQRELRATSRVTRKEARLNAVLLAHMVKKRAEMRGMTPLDYWKADGLAIVRGSQAEARSPEVGDLGMSMVRGLKGSDPVTPIEVKPQDWDYHKYMESKECKKKRKEENSKNL